MASPLFSTLLFLALLSTLSLVSAEDVAFAPMDKEQDVDGFDSLPHIVSIEREKVPVSIKSSASSQFGVASQIGEKSIYAVKESRSGYARLARSGVSVMIGSKATMHYHKRFRGVSSAKLARMDRLFIETLSRAEKRQYFKKKSFSGGLDVPFLRFLGINLFGRTSKMSMDKAARRTRQYNRKATAVKKILQKISKTSVTVSGSITALGVSFRPTAAFAFIEVARVKLSTGQVVTVVSSNKSGLHARTSTGNTLPTTGKNVKIEDEDDYFF